jgi:hypothetical protein
MPPKRVVHREKSIANLGFRFSSPRSLSLNSEEPESKWRIVAFVSNFRDIRKLANLPDTADSGLPRSDHRCFPSPRATGSKVDGGWGASIATTDGEAEDEHDEHWRQPLSPFPNCRRAPTTRRNTSTTQAVTIPPTTIHCQSVFIEGFSRVWLSS